MRSYCGDLRLDACKEIARTLRASGKYSRVRVRKVRPEMINGQRVEYGHIYVERRPEVNHAND